jgi:hypothetical protein
VCVVHGKAALYRQLCIVPGTPNKQFLGLVFLTASRLLGPAKSVTQANHQHVLFGGRLLAHIALQRRLMHISTAIE